jgi:hypothetical protein
MPRRVPIPPLPAQIGPCQLSPFGEKWIAVRCPSDLDPLMRQAGGLREPGSRRWLVERWRIGPVLRALAARHCDHKCPYRPIAPGARRSPHLAASAR